LKPNETRRKTDQAYRPPHGGRGLKRARADEARDDRNIAPRTGGAD